MFTKMLRKIVAKINRERHHSGHCDSDDSGSGHCDYY